jgi:hypothetical protein
VDFGYRRCYYRHGGAVFVRGGQMNAQLSGALDAVENDINILRDELEQAHARIGNLLAVIHGDGGQYQAEYGDLAATTDAILKWRGAMLRIAELEEAARWIPVSERLPEDELTVLATSGGAVDTSCIFEGAWYQLGTPVRITHWRPLPTPPEAQS